MPREDEGQSDYSSGQGNVGGAPISSFFQRRIRSLRTPAGFYNPSSSRDISGTASVATSVSLNSVSQWSDSSKPVQDKMTLSRRGRFNHDHHEESADDAVMRSDINDLISKKARLAQLRDEPIRLDAEESVDSFVLRPDMRLRRYWDMYVLVMLVYVATVSVFVYSFLGLLGPTSPWFWVERFIDVSFAVDIFLNFFTAYEKIGVLVTDRKAIRRHYARTWLIPDVLATFPWDALGLSLQDDTSKPNILKLPRYLRLVRLLKLIRLTRILRLKQGVTKLEVKLRLKYGYIRLAGLILSVMLTAHWFACLFFYFGSIGGFKMTWVSQEGIPIDLYGRYIASLYFSVYTITTIGYGDVVPENTLERSFTTIIMFLGAAVFAYVISQVSNIAGELNESSAHHRKVLDSLTDFATYRQLPDDLVYDIRRYFQREHLRQRVAHEKELLEAINRDLRIKVFKHMYGTQLEHSRLFKDIPSGHLDEVYNNVVERFARKDEKLFSEGDHPNCFYIILKGGVELHEPGVPVVHLDKDDIFGDNDMLFNRPRDSSAVCASYTELIEVPRKVVMSTLMRHPSAWKNLRDEEALWLWDKAMNVVQHQIKYTKIASQLRMRGDVYMLKKGVETGRRVVTARDPRSLHQVSKSEIPQEALAEPLLERRAQSMADAVDRALSDHLSSVNGDRDGPGGMARTFSVEAMRAELQAKTAQVRKLESNLQDLQRQVNLILGGLRGEQGVD